MQYALALEKELTKDQILERYLNIAAVRPRRLRHLRGQPGLLQQGAEGPDAGRGGPARRPGQGAEHLRPDHRDGLPAGARAARPTCIDQMVKLGYITQAEADAGQDGQAQASPGKRTPERLRRRQPATTGASSATTSTAGGSSQHAFGADDVRAGAPAQDRRLPIITTLDMQGPGRRATRTSRKHLAATRQVRRADAGRRSSPAPARSRRWRPTGTSATTRAAEQAEHRPGEGQGQIKGNYPNTTVPLSPAAATSPATRPARRSRSSPWSPRWRRAIPLASRSTRSSSSSRTSSSSPSDPAACQGTHYYCPTNAGRARPASYNMWTGFGSSVNTFFVPLRSRSARRTWSTWPSGSASSSAAATTTSWATSRTAPTVGRVHPRRLGTTPLELANAYATLAADGKYCEPMPVSRSPTWTARSSTSATRAASRPITPDVARAAAGRGPLPGRRPTRPRQVRRRRPPADATAASSSNPVAGKTGTTDGNKTAALIAMTKQLAVAGILADPDYAADHPADDARHHDGQPGGRRHAARRHGGQAGDRVQPPRPKIASTATRSHPEREVPVGRPGDRAALEGAGFTVVVAGTGRLGLPGRHGRQHQPDRPHHQGRRRHHRLSSGSGSTPNPAAPAPAPAAAGHRPRRPQRRRTRGGRPGGDRRASTKAGRPAGDPPCASAVEPSCRVSVRPSWRRTSAATRPPSARPATAACAAFIAGPICALPVKPPVGQRPRDQLGELLVGELRRQVAVEDLAPRRAPCAACSARPGVGERGRPPPGASSPPWSAPPSTSSSESSRAWPCRRPRRCATAASAIRSVDVVSSSRAFMAARRSAFRRSFSVLMDGRNYPGRHAKAHRYSRLAAGDRRRRRGHARLRRR